MTQTIQVRASNSMDRPGKRTQKKKPKPAILSLTQDTVLRLHCQLSGKLLSTLHGINDVSFDDIIKFVVIGLLNTMSNVLIH